MTKAVGEGARDQRRRPWTGEASSSINGGIGLAPVLPRLWHSNEQKSRGERGRRRSAREIGARKARQWRQGFEDLVRSMEAAVLHKMWGERV